MHLHDWFDTRLYQTIYDTRNLEFNHEEDPGLFSSPSEVTAALNELHNPHPSISARQVEKEASDFPNQDKNLPLQASQARR